MQKASVLSAVLFVASSLAFGPVNTASLTGLVTDPSHAPGSDANVTLTNTATNLAQTTQTGAAGYYEFPVIQVGTYKLKVERPGFQTVISALTLDIGQRARFDIPLKIGSSSESVTVECTIPLLSTQDAMPGAVVENELISGAPLSARNWDDLLVLVPGVQADRYTEQGGGTAAGRTGGANVHGVRSLQNNFVLDGVDNNSFSENVQELTTQIIRPSVDAIQEFKVSTNPYSAENGRSPGSLISVTTKNGTNTFHGGVYEYLRNRIFDANDYFTNRAGRAKPEKVQNQFGGLIGGPVIKNKAFFFFNYEGTRIRTGRFYQASVPTANERLGNFSAAAGTANRVTYAQIFDNVGSCIPKVNGVAQPFPNNQIPSSCIDAASAKILGLVPGSNFTPASGPLNANDFVNTRTLSDDGNSYTGRFDWSPTQANNLWVRYSNTHRLRYVPGTFGGILDGTSTSAAGRLTMNAASASIGWNHLFGPKLVNEFRIGWGRDWSHGVQDPFGLNKESDFIQGVADNPLYNGGIPRIAISARGGTQSNTTSTLSGVDNWGSPDFLPKQQFTNQFQWMDTIDLTRDKHQLRFGVDARLPMRNIFLDVPAMRGRMSFDGARTSNGTTTTGISVADFLLGYVQSAELANPLMSDARLWMLSEFVQDDWKIFPKLTLNLGLRYDYATWPYSGNDHMLNVLNPNQAAVNATATLFCAGSSQPAPCSPAASPFGHTLVKPDKNNFAPRVGIAWQVTPNTVVRTGYGRFYMLFERAGSEDQMYLNPPYLVDKAVSAPSTSTTANNMRVATGFNLSLDPSALNLTQIRFRTVNPNNVQPEVDQWNLGIEHGLPGGVVATAEYVGTKGTHLSVLMNLNQQYFDSQGRACVAVGTASPNCPNLGAPGTGILPYLEYQNLGAIEWRNNAGNSTYHGLELSANKRFSHGLSFTSSYTWSHSIDTSMEQLFGGGSNTFLQNMHDLRQWRGNSDFDVRHRLVFSYVYELPFGPGHKLASSGTLSHLVREWHASSITSIHTGRPFTIFSGNNNSLVQVGGQLGSALGDCLRGSVSGGVSEDRLGNGPAFFDVTAFAVPSAASPTGTGTVPRLGTCPRNTLYGPGLTNVDFSLGRTFGYFGEGRSLEFRWEAFNLLNTPYFGLPQHDVSSCSSINGVAATAPNHCGNFGRITSLQGDPRTMQFSLRFMF